VAEFDPKKPLKFTGTITEIEWVTPHTWFHVDVKKPDGTVEDWAVEAGNPNALFRRGVTKRTFPVGTAIVVEGYGAKDGSHRMNGRDMTLPDGRSFFLGSSDGGALAPSKAP